MQADSNEKVQQRLANGLCGNRNTTPIRLYSITIKGRNSVSFSAQQRMLELWALQELAIEIVVCIYLT